MTLYAVTCTQKAVDETDAPTLRRLAAYVAAEHASACARTLQRAENTATASPAAAAGAAAAARSELFALNPRLPRRPPRSLPAAVLDAGGAPPQDTARAVATLADLLTAGNQVLACQRNLGMACAAPHLADGRRACGQQRYWRCLPTELQRTCVLSAGRDHTGCIDSVPCCRGRIWRA